MNLYFAGPLFNQAELNFNVQLTEKIEALGYQVFLPQRDGIDMSQAPYNEMTTADQAKVIFDLDRDRMLTTDVFLYVLDGRVPDEGAAVALGMVYNHKVSTNANIDMVGLHTDKRSAQLNERLNPMIFSALDKIFDTEDQLLTYLTK